MRILFYLVASVLACSPAMADPEDFEIPRLVTITGYEANAMEPFLSRDGQFLFFNNRDEPEDQTDIHYARRIDDLEFEYVGKLDGANSTSLDGAPSLDRMGNFFFVSPRDYESSRNTLWQGNFAGGSLSDIREVSGDVSRYNPLWLNMDAEISANGNRLYLVENEWRLFGGGIKSSDIFISRKSLNGEFFRMSQLDELVSQINTSDLEYGPALSEDELTLYFTRVPPQAARNGDSTAFGIWVATRSSVNDPFEPPVRIEAIQGYVEGPTVADRGCALYFHQKVRDVFRIMRANKSDCEPS